MKVRAAVNVGWGEVIDAADEMVGSDGYTLDGYGGYCELEDEGEDEGGDEELGAATAEGSAASNPGASLQKLTALVKKLEMYESINFASVAETLKHATQAAYNDSKTLPVSHKAGTLPTF